MIAVVLALVAYVLLLGIVRAIALPARVGSHRRGVAPGTPAQRIRWAAA